MRFLPTGWPLRLFPLDLCIWERDDDDVEFEQNTLTPSQFAHHWKLGKMAQEALPEAMAKSKLRRFLANNLTPRSTEIKMGKFRGSAPKSRGPPVILEANGTGVAAKFRNRTCKTGRCRVRGR